LIVLSSLTFYPIKSCRGISVASAELDDRGIRHDRRWMLVDATGRFLTQREWPRLALVKVSLLPDALALDAPRMSPLRVPLHSDSRTPQQVLVWNDVVTAYDSGNEAAAWFSEFLGAPTRLVFMPDNATRVAQRNGLTSRIGFVDAYPMLLMSESSVADLNSRLSEPVPMNRFRPNLVITGALPYAEDGWDETIIDGINFRCVKPCARCVTTTVKQETGEKGTEPLRTLAAYRSVGGNVLFGMNVMHAGIGSIHVGSTVSIVEK
jgi:uncharacterized protein YcbX